MYGGFLSLFESPESRKARHAAEKRYAERLLQSAVPWDPKMRFTKELAVEADSYQKWLDGYKLFDVKHSAPGSKRTASQEVVSPDGKLAYVHFQLPRAAPLSIAQSNKRGSVYFNDSVIMPALVMQEGYSKDDVWMSMTPMEVFTMRGGIRRAKGNVCIAGLGLGYQLIEVCKRKQVKTVTLVERDAKLIDWLWPSLQEKLSGRHVYIQEGDAREIVPNLQVDVALIDIFRSYGGNEFPHCPNIGYVWCWGSQYVA